MKSNNILTLLMSVIVLTASCKKDKVISPGTYNCNLPFADSSYKHPAHAKYQALLSEISGSGVPGIMMSVHSAEGMWAGAAGKADLNDGTDMQPCNITRAGSTVKTFTATTVLLLQEEGKLDLDDKIADYLGGDVLKDIANADKATIRQLLQHSSGIYNYIQNLKFQTASLNDLIKEWQPEELLNYARGRKAYFEPGTDVVYSNTNYILLGMLITKIEGKPFYEVFKERIFIPQGLTFTNFAAKDPVPDNIVRGYVDFYSNLNVTEATYYSGWDYYTADGGLISNAYDLNLFMTALFNGQILNQASLDEMNDWKEPKEADPEFFPIASGLGMFKMDTKWGAAYFHSGDAIGYAATMIYFPDSKTTICWAVNGNYGKIDEFTFSKAAMEHIFETVFD